MSLAKLQDLIKKHGIKIVDFRFIDMPGLWQHFSVTLDEINEGLFADGIGFDGSSIRGFQEIQESDMVLLPDSDSAFVDPYLEIPTLAVICDVLEPGLKPYTRSPREVAKKAETYLKSTGIADTAYFGPEPEFFIFDDVRFDQNSQCGYYYVDSVEA
ncbi:MAG: glutamine synthetase beta-grasp domain-containing protein, partial [Gammaproteobacteria bacterium]